jgi:uncharacterized protein YdcH (DUF465 family)
LERRQDRIDQERKRLDDERHRLEEREGQTRRPHIENGARKQYATICIGSAMRMVWSCLFRKGLLEKDIMTDTHHDLAHEFPEYKEKIHTLKLSDDHFRRLKDEYEDLNKQIARSEQRIDLLSEADEERLRKGRLALRDSLFAILKKH